MKLLLFVIASVLARPGFLSLLSKIEAGKAAKAALVVGNIERAAKVAEF